MAAVRWVREARTHECTSSHVFVYMHVLLYGRDRQIERWQDDTSFQHLISTPCNRRRGRRRRRTAVPVDRVDAGAMASWESALRALSDPAQVSLEAAGPVSCSQQARLRA